MPGGALARSLYHLIDHHRIAQAVALFAPPLQRSIGDDLSAWLAGFPDLRISVRQLVTDDDSVAVWTRLVGTHDGRFAGVSPTGRKVEVSGADFLVVRDGRFVECVGLRDLNSLWVQLGVAPGDTDQSVP